MDGGIERSLEMTARDEQEQRRRARIESLKWLGLGRKKEKVYNSGSVVPVCGSNPDYRWTSNLGWSHQSGLKVLSWLVAPTETRG